MLPVTVNSRLDEIGELNKLQLCRRKKKTVWQIRPTWPPTAKQGRHRQHRLIHLATESATRDRLGRDSLFNTISCCALRYKQSTCESNAKRCQLASCR